MNFGIFTNKNTRMFGASAGQDLIWPFITPLSGGLNYLMYNDEVPGGMKIFNRGHAKGEQPITEQYSVNTALWLAVYTILIGKVVLGSRCWQFNSFICVCDLFFAQWKTVKSTIQRHHHFLPGVLMFDSSSIVFLVHSTPHFPNNRSDGYEFPDSGTK